MRHEMKIQSPMGMNISRFVNSGKLIPDDVVNGFVAQALKDMGNRGFILDGYPRTRSQALFLENNYCSAHNVVAVNIVLDRKIIIEKLLGRKICGKCGGNFNTAHIVNDQFDMPAIMPDKDHCILGVHCKPELVSRIDDTSETIMTRLLDYERNMGPLLQFYEERNQLLSFYVEKGVKDTPKLWKAMHEFNLQT